MTISNLQILMRLLAAVLLGCLFGMERKRRLKPVGMRTHVLICLSCTTLTMISAYGFGQFAGAGLTNDPARLMVGILTGIGFIGAGIIWKSATGMVQGVTTAADILLLASLGIALGLGLFFLAGMAALIGFITLESNNWEAAWKKRRVETTGAETEEQQTEEQQTE